ncbi:hypothetical protein JZ751_019110 [Albula glossodonta]|uniref:Uncharacterized protein n=1 Tax=Albula glossodonta TaxID=121402 RepID=A0A8T2NMJ3_9TELE|nr:hypothetical protein JZ751_019110 [Albula glossodonta]
MTYRCSARGYPCLMPDLKAKGPEKRLLTTNLPKKSFRVCEACLHGKHRPPVGGMRVANETRPELSLLCLEDRVEPGVERDTWKNIKFADPPSNAETREQGPHPGYIPW